MTQNEPRIPMPLNLVDLEATLAEAKLHWPKKQLPELTAREVAALREGAKLIPLTKGKWAIVDPDDYETFSKYNWCLFTGGRGGLYAKRAIGVAGQHVTIRLHQEIFGSTLNVIDHVDGDGLNNQKKNLRPATSQQNGQNQKIKRSNKHGLKGVCFHAKKHKYYACITISGKQISLGYHLTPEAAHKAYCEASTRLFGHFARHS